MKRWELDLRHTEINTIANEIKKLEKLLFRTTQECHSIYVMTHFDDDKIYVDFSTKSQKKALAKIIKPKLRYQKRKLIKKLAAMKGNPDA